MIWRPRLRAAAGPNPDPKNDDSEPEATLISIPTVPEYRDPLHVILEYIAEERPNCDMVIVHDDDLALLDVLGDGASIETFQPDVVLSFLRGSKLIVIHEVELGPDLSSGNNSANPDTEIVRVASFSANFEGQSWSLALELGGLYTLASGFEGFGFFLSGFFIFFGLQLQSSKAFTATRALGKTACDS
ncbi:hypothetical protein EI94DRAFT_1759074 [Lactarius quietus]|nr:hypothetical protein EI94DRAFT_1759074 [Lactarius quietus]